MIRTVRCERYIVRGAVSEQPRPGAQARSGNVPSGQGGGLDGRGVGCTGEYDPGRRV